MQDSSVVCGLIWPCVFMVRMTMLVGVVLLVCGFMDFFWKLQMIIASFKFNQNFYT